MKTSLRAALLLLLGPALSGAQAPALIERVFRTELTAIAPIYAPGAEGNAERIVGLRTRANVYAITAPIPGGLLPPQTPETGRLIGQSESELRLPAGVFLNKSLPTQVASATGRFVAESEQIRFEFQGTSIIRWVHGADGQYTGARWTDFSGAIFNVQGRHAGARGHVIGTRFLVGDPQLTFQSGIEILRIQGTP